MNKYPCFLHVSLSCVASMLFLIAPPLKLDARIGERCSNYEGNVLGSGGIVSHKEAMAGAQAKKMAGDKLLLVSPKIDVLLATTKTR